MQRIHFTGIGGIGVSALASIYLEKGYHVQGSDLKESATTQELQDKGAEIFIGHDASHLSSSDLVVYSAAVPENNPELQQAKKFDIKTQVYAQALGDLSKNYFTIAVSGTHGKSTTASMIAQVLIKANLDPTFIIGTKPGSRVGKSKYLVIEADEYKSSCLNYHPQIMVLTNIEAEHLDYFRDLNHILDIFGQYISQVQELIIANADDSNIKKAIGRANCKVQYYQAQDLKLQVPGVHNRYNAAAALEVARALEIDDSIALQALSEYSGVWRRFEIKGEVNGAIVIDDYAHHPTEVKATLQGAREKYPKKQIITVFQPHHYQRLKALFGEFVEAFDQADQVIITDVFSVAGREEKIEKTGKDLANAVQKAKYVAFDKLAVFIKKKATPNDVILMMGAGDIIKVTERIIE